MKHLESNFSQGCLDEISAFNDMKNDFSKLKDAKSIDEYIKYSGSLAPQEYKNLDYLLNKNSKILDVGVGTGASSLYLCSIGHKVTSIDPVEFFCELIDQKSEEFKLSLNVYCGIGEDIERIDEKFDAVFFNASLHHCDDPLKALKSAYSVLNKDGKIFLVNESILQPWRTKNWFKWMLENDPISVGHYGGNEHVYYSWEYQYFLKSAGFISITRVQPLLISALDKLEVKLSRRVNGKRVHSSISSIALRFFLYVLEQNIKRSKLLFSVMSKFSIFQCHFIGRK